MGMLKIYIDGFQDETIDVGDCVGMATRSPQNAENYLFRIL